MKRRKPIRRYSRPKRTAIRAKQIPLAERKANAYSTYWRNKADRLWSEIVRGRAGGRCEKCGKRVGAARLNPHHLIGRAAKMIRHDLNNGMALCSYCHTLGNEAVHHSVNSWRFYDWLQARYPERWAWMQEHKHSAGRANFRDAFITLEQAQVSGADRPEWLKEKQQGVGK